MAENTKIEWADHTFNPWIGCTKISPACDNCYAEEWDGRFNEGKHWGPHAHRRRTSAQNWQKPLKWDAAAKSAGKKAFVFCASLADVFDNAASARDRDDLWHLIHKTPNLIWLLLTKRPQNIAKMLPDSRIGVPEWGDGWPNVWLGTTVENQEVADRNIPELIRIPAACRFLSCEPMLGGIDLTKINTMRFRGGELLDCLNGKLLDWLNCEVLGNMPKIHWVIAGGESGPNARPSHPDWFRSLRDQCEADGVPFLFKQWGAWKPWTNRAPPEWESPAGGREEHCDLIPAEIDDDPNWDDGLWAIIDGLEPYAFQRLGKTKTGRVLDGVVHDGRPEAG